MPSEKFEEALNKFNWNSALKLLQEGENISEYLQPSNIRLHLVIIHGYRAHLDHIDDVNHSLSLQDWPCGDYFAEEDLSNDLIVKFIECLMLRGLILDKLVEGNKTARESLKQLSPKLDQHTTNFMQSEQMQFKLSMFALFQVQHRNQKLKNLTIPKEINMNIAEFMSGISYRQQSLKIDKKV